MSNAKKSPGAVFGPRSPSASSTPPSSTDGVTLTPFASSTPCSTSASSGMAMTCGASTQGPPTHSPPSLAERVSASDYTMRVNAVAERIAEATEQRTALALLHEGISALGAESAVFISFVRDNTDVSSCRFMLACEPDWCQRYLDAGFIAQDPWIAYAAHHSEPIVASTLTIADPERKRVVELAAKNGFASAVLVPAHSGAGHSRISLLCLGSATPGYFEGEGFGRFKLGARTLALELHDWWLARIRRELIVKARITPDDLELLRHQRQGHSSKHIASELHVSKSSINSRFQRMISKLGVPNRKMAARLASECGLIRE